MERLFILVLRGILLFVGAVIALIFIALVAGGTVAGWSAVAICIIGAVIAGNVVRIRRDAVDSLVGPSVILFAFLAMAGFLSYKMLAPERFPTLEPGEPTESVKLPGLQLVGQWPQPARLGPGWEVRRTGEFVTVEPACEGLCITRFPPPSMTIARAAEPPGSEPEGRIVGADGRVLRYRLTNTGEPRMCTSTMSGVLTIEGIDYDVSCSYTTEDGCGGGGKWCLELLANLEPE